MARIKKTNYFNSEEKNHISSSATNSEMYTSAAKHEHIDANLDKSQYNFEHDDESDKVLVRKVILPQSLLSAVKGASTKLYELGFPALANDMSALYKLAVNKRFSIAFVGEFSKGKSTLINRILGDEILPTAILPTTAVITRITYGKNPKITICDYTGHTKKEIDLRESSWKGLTAANFGEKEPEGYAIVDYPDKWLGKYAIDFIDTPGAGDLNDQRIRIIERSMINADAAIITISADKAISLTEELFIKQKIMSRSVPFVALAVTKLDLVDEKDRAGIISYLISKLKLMKLSIPIIIPDDTINIPGLIKTDDFAVLFGIDQFRKMVMAWMTNPKRESLMEKWLTTNALAIINSAKGFLLQQEELLNVDEEKRNTIINQRNAALLKIHESWEKLRQEMINRCNQCVESFNSAAIEFGDSMIETLQHEADRQPSPKDWLEKEYTYRVKRELSAISVALDNLVARRVSADVRWLNGELNKQFKTLVGSEVAALMSKEDFIPTVDNRSVKFKSLKDKSMKATIVSSSLSLGAALILGATGAAPLLFATLGVGTVTNLVFKKRLEKEVERQKEILKELIAQQIPNVIKEASADGKTKIKIIYNDILSESHKTESRWIKTQQDIIRESINAPGKDAREKLSEKINVIKQLSTTFS